MSEINKYYQVLGLKPGVSKEEVREAHMVLLMVWHPDRISDDPRLRECANERLREINVAFRKIVSSIDQGTSP